MSLQQLIIVLLSVVVADNLITALDDTALLTQSSELGQRSAA